MINPFKKSHNKKTVKPYPKPKLIKSEDEVDLENVFFEYRHGFHWYTCKGGKFHCQDTGEVFGSEMEIFKRYS